MNLIRPITRNRGNMSYSITRTTITSLLKNGRTFFVICGSLRAAFRLRQLILRKVADNAGKVLSAEFVSNKQKKSKDKSCYISYV